MTALFKKAALFITDRCNLRCDYCYEKNNEGRTIDKDSAEKAIDFLLSSSTPAFALSFFGGEPLLNIDLIESLMEYCRLKSRTMERRISFLINTNGMLLDRKNLDILGRYGVMVVLSLDGEPESHDLHRKVAGGGGSFSLIQKNLPHIKEYPRLHVRMTVTPETVSRLSANVRFIRELGFRTAAFALNRDSDEWNDERLDILESEYEKLTDWYVEDLRGGSPFRLVDIDLFAAKGKRKLKKGRPPCAAGETSVAVGADGSLYPCHRFVGSEAAIIGDVRRGLCAEHAEPFRRFDPYGVKECGDCALIGECYKCMWLSFVKKGALSARVPAACRESRIFIKSAVKVAQALS